MTHYLDHLQHLDRQPYHVIAAGVERCEVFANTVAAFLHHAQIKPCGEPGQERLARIASRPRPPPRRIPPVVHWAPFPAIASAPLPCQAMNTELLLAHPDFRILIYAVLLLVGIYVTVMYSCWGTLSLSKVSVEM